MRTDTPFPIITTEGAPHDRGLQYGSQARELIGEWSRTIRTGRLPDIAGPPSEPACPALLIAYEGDFLAPMNSVNALAGLLDGTAVKLPVNWPGWSWFEPSSHGGAGRRSGRQ